MSVTDEIKARIDVVDFISRYVPLQRAGRSYKACCPFHQERTPSFVVFPESGTWRCFGACSTGGDVFSFLMQKENLNFREALQQLATETGVQLPEETEEEDARERALLLELNARAALYFRNQLHRSPQAELARTYLKNRGINAQVAEQFQLGFAPDSWDGLLHHLQALGYTPDAMHRAGLLKHNEERNSYYDAFRHRLMIPIQDRMGRVIGFGGRVLDDSVPKYLNTAETPLFHKSHVVYGLNLAHRAIRDQDAVVIVEGYMDVIAAQQFGFANVVACLGTALTEEQLRQLQRYTDNYILALDADAAGQQATIRGLNQARLALKRKAKPVLTPGGRMRVEHRLSANLRITALPEGRDPDDIVRQDPDLWRDLVNGATPLVDYYFDIVAGQYDLQSAHGKAEAVAELTPLIAELSDEIERQHYVQQLSRLVQIDEQTIAQRVQAAARALRHPPGESRHRRRFTRPQTEEQTKTEQEAKEGTNASQLPTAPKQATTVDPKGKQPLENQRQQPVSPEASQEGFLLSHLLLEPNLLVWLAGLTDEMEIPPLRSQDFQQIEYREIFEALHRFVASDELWDIENFQEALSPNLHDVLGSLLAQAGTMPERDPSEIQDALLKLLIRIRRERLRENLSAMQFLLHDAQESDDREAILEFSAAINANRRDRHHLERVLVRRNRIAYGVTRVESGVQIA